MIRNYEMQPNFGLDADNHKSTTTICSPEANSTNGGKIVEDNKQQLNINNDSNQEVGDNTPKHQTRRPMNAFFMFCKRHREIVTEKFPDLENRKKSKILGNWWESIDEGEKEAYMNLAKEYKVAFLSDHPNFKWFKLPKPPPQTRFTRQSLLGSISTTICEDNYDYGVPDIANYEIIEVKQEIKIEEPFDYEEEGVDADYTNNESEIETDNNECPELIYFDKVNSREINLSLNEISTLNVNNERENNRFNNKIDCINMMPSSNIPPLFYFKMPDTKYEEIVKVDNQNLACDENSRNNGATSNNETSTESFIQFVNKQDSKISNNLKRKMNSVTTTTSIDTTPKFKSKISFVWKNPNKDFAVNNKSHNIGKDPLTSKEQRCKEFMTNSDNICNSSNQINSEDNKNDICGSSTMSFHGATSQFSDDSNLKNEGMCDAVQNHHFATEEFDLENRIKALPLLNLELFLERKRKLRQKKLNFEA